MKAEIRKEEGGGFIAVYPGRDRRGMRTALPFRFVSELSGGESAIFEAHCEIDDGYFRALRPIPMEQKKRCAAALNRRGVLC